VWFSTPAARGVRLAGNHLPNLNVHFIRHRLATERIQFNMTLDSVPKKVGARVVAIHGSGSGRLRLMEMGIVPGALVKVVNSAPLGDPLKIFVRDYHLALRREDARSVHVTLCDERVASPALTSITE
jgi:ferrous iron transport protein A